MAVSTASILSRLLQHKTTKPRTESSGTKAVISSILVHLKVSHLQKAVSILFAFPDSVPYSLYAHLLHLCSLKSAIVEARKVESHLISFSPSPPIFLLNRCIETYGKCRSLDDAKEMFDEMPQRDGGSWNSIITAYTRNGYPENALHLFLKMTRDGVLANEITFASVLGSCGLICELGLSRQIHGLIVKYGFLENVILGSSLVDVYGKCGIMSDARRMFDGIENPNAVSCNVIVRRYLEMGEEEEAIVMFFNMFREDIRPLNFTFSTALIACSGLCALKEGKEIHGVAIKFNLEKDMVVSSSLIDMYVKCAEVESARRIFNQLGSKDVITWTSIISGYVINRRTREARDIFNEMPERNVISWNAMLAGYVRIEEWEQAADFLLQMRNEFDHVDSVTLGLILSICSGLSDVEMGKQVHGFVYRHGFCSNIFIGNNLLNMYGKCGNLRSARNWFYQLNQWRDRVSWNALLSSYARRGRSEQALLFFGEMQWEVRPSKFTFGTLLAACANIFAVKLGKQIHGFMIRNGYDIDIVIRGALVDMYSKCHCLDYALMVFMEEASHDVVLWNSMILGCCHNGRGREVLELIRLMVEDGVKPDHVTFQGILRACVYECQLELGRKYFNLMSDEYFVIPRLEHYEWMIELYCRCGSMYELENFVKAMPFEPTTRMMIRILNACQKYGFLKLGEWAARRLNGLNNSVPISC